MSYVSQLDIQNYVDAVNLQAFVDDWAQGVEGQSAQSAQLDSICSIASNNVDAYVSSIYATPFVNPPATVKAAAAIFAVEILYQRRLTPQEKNPFSAQANIWRERLQKIGAGELPLDEGLNRGFSPVVFGLNKSKVNTNIF